MDFNFNINWNLLVYRNLPNSKRNDPVYREFLRAGRKALEQVYLDFLNKVNETRKILSTDGKVISLERFLNRTFIGADQWANTLYPDAGMVTTAGGIWIDHPSNSVAFSNVFLEIEGQSGLTIFTQGEGVSGPFSQAYIYSDAEYAQTVDFIVNVPNWWLTASGFSAPTFETIARQVIDNFRRAGTRYSFNYY